MSNSYRIRTTPGVDKSIRVKLDQDFESLEILSLKLFQSDVYTRRCSDYGVLVGRVSINNGFGVPNAKVSVFIPLTDQDEVNNPIISDLYPFKNLTQTDGGGYIYNLLPQEQSYSNHVPTGSFFTRNEVLTNPTKIEIYDKYYKFNAVTNDSGDYMIVGVPLGSQTIVLNVDLSDIGEFSLAPQDLIRMGVATEQEVSGTKFKSSTNLRELPQIITINRNIEIQPFWGETEVCEVGITRTDFDLSAEKNITIQPTAIFMGSVISNEESQSLKLKCKPALKSGTLCNLVAGPGQIQAIRHTIDLDDNGRPGLEVARLESNGQVIDDNGAWMVDVPMNLDYVVTNEFGEQVISRDPKKGIPTKGRYRFKIMWNQSTDLGARIKRANFLVPNVKEYGWTTAEGNDPLTNRKVATAGSFGNADNPCSYSNVTNNNFKAANASYAFSLDWNDYGVTGGTGALTTLGQRMVNEAVNCEDRFYEMQYNKVYTVSQLISEYRKGGSNNRIIAIKNILDDACESTNNKFPTNDGMYRLDILFLLFQFMMNIFYPLLFVILVVAHIFYWVLCNIILPVLEFLATVVCGLADGVCEIAGTCFLGVCPFGFLNGLCNKLRNACNSLNESVRSLREKCKNTQLKLPALTYPDCELCACEPTITKGAVDDGNALTKFNAEQGSNTAFADLMNVASFKGPFAFLNPFISAEGSAFGRGASDDRLFITGQLVMAPKDYTTRGLPSDTVSNAGVYGTERDWMKTTSTDLPWHERFNLFNTKAKYFDNSSNNPGGGVNRIGVRFNADLNGGPLSGNLTGKYHLDNVVAMLLDDTEKDSFKAGVMVSFVDPEKSKDVNISNANPANFAGTNSMTGTTLGSTYNGDPKIKSTLVNVSYAHTDGTTGNISMSQPYIITGNSEPSYHKFPMDVEYFQVIENISLGDYVDAVTSYSPDLSNSFFSRVIDGTFNLTSTGIIRCENIPFSVPSQYKLRVYYESRSGMVYDANNTIKTIRHYYQNSNKLRVVFMVRGVDPNSPKTQISYDLSRLYGKQAWGTRVVTLENVRMNIPVQGKFKCVKHNISSSDITDGYSGVKLFHKTFMFQPGVTSPGVPVVIDPSTIQYDDNGDPLTNQTPPPSYYNPPSTDPEYRPVDWACFKSFSTTAHTYYSKIDSDSFYGEYNWILEQNSNYSYQAVKNGDIGLRVSRRSPHTVQIGRSDGSTTCDLQYPDLIYDYCPLFESGLYVYRRLYNDDNGTVAGPYGGYIYARNNSGYFINESVEGGSVILTAYNGGLDVNNTTYTQLNQPDTFGTYYCKYGDTWPDKIPNLNEKLINGSYYVSYTYSNNIGGPPSMTMKLGDDNRQIVMRSDRLPSSSSPELGWETSGSGGPQSYTFMANNNFAFFIIGDDGSTTPLVGGAPVDGVGAGGDNAAANAEIACPNVLNTFSCEGLIPLDCYYYDQPNNRVGYYVRPEKIPSTGNRNNDGCYGNGLTGSGVFGDQPEAIMQGGCYLTVTKPFASLELDRQLLKEWKARMIVTFGACRNIFSHYFTNNWINGTLYAFSFKNSRRFTSPINDNPALRNKPYNCYCKNNIYFNQGTNNFYYRSAPFSETNGFVGRKNPVNWLTNKQFGGNINSLMYPTTIMDMGPRDIYTQEIVFSNDYDGYVMKSMNSSTFQDVSDLLNVFILTRITNRTFMQKMIGGAGILRYFSRQNLKIDGDYAQSIAINSELGIDGFDEDSYNSCDIYYNGGDLDNGIFGIFYSADTQLRDYVTPKRTIINEDTTLDAIDCSFEYFKVKTQEVPFYQWNIIKNFPPNKDNEDPSPGALTAASPPDSIFGGQKNDWVTKDYSSTAQFFSHGYQNLDRLSKKSRYFRTKGSTKSKYFRGNIYSVNPSENQDGNIAYWDFNESPIPGNKFERVINTGAPFYFYFGLNQGKSAFDKFYKKWIEGEIITD